MIDIEQENYKFSINPTESDKGGLRKRLVNKGDSASKFEGGDNKEVDVNSVQLELDSSGDENQTLLKSKKEA